MTRDITTQALWRSLEQRPYPVFQPVKKRKGDLILTSERVVEVRS